MHVYQSLWTLNNATDVQKSIADKSVCADSLLNVFSFSVTSVDLTQHLKLFISQTQLYQTLVGTFTNTSDVRKSVADNSVCTGSRLGGFQFHRCFCPESVIQEF